MTATFVLVHSPFLGPASWQPVAEELGRCGHRAVIPPLVREDEDGLTSPRHCAAAVADAIRDVDGPLVLVGHSGGGLLLPAIAQASSAPVSHLIFVDSGLPVESGDTRAAPSEFLDFLRGLSVDGILPPWSDWWGTDVMADLVPDERMRTRLVDEMPLVPISYIERSVPSPFGWDRVECGYLLLSEAYISEADEAVRRGWPIGGISCAQHLDIVVRPEIVADALLDFLSPGAGRPEFGNS
ncbi:MAG TPA: alpha/beta fold hydrolase [Gaiellales bacterium]|jgi:pimeloyl-ACP methyl ester carboxylesterase|nr:alpha/beta fold hydrolase [Gaiellales bacterium]